jgi:putative ABC transport system permease protein
MLPLRYNIRNLRVRWATTVMTACATGLVVWASVLTFGLAHGLERALLISGDEMDLIVLRKGSTDEMSSGVETDVAREVATVDGIETNENGEPLCSAEFVTILTKPRRGDGGTTNLVVRGLENTGRALRPGFKILDGGRIYENGKNEAITSLQIARRFRDTALGEELEINNVPFRIVGHFAANGSAAESEVWTDVNALTIARRTPGAVSSVNLRARDAAARDALVTRIQDDEQFNLKVVTEKEYYKEQMSASIAIKVIGYFIATFLTVGAMFAAANTMYAAVASRAREIGTLRALGFSRRSILTSFMFESVVICLLGGALGCVGTLPFNGISTGTANWATFSEITFAFNFGPKVLLEGVLMALVMGLMGGLLPAVRAVRMNIVKALREI